MEVNRSALLGPVAVFVQLLIALDLAFTFTGIGNGGVEANPFFAVFVEMGTYPMLLGMIGYIITVWITISILPRWLRAIELGALAALHTFGVLSWITYLFLPQLGFMFSPFWIMTVASFIAAIGTMFAYVQFNPISPDPASSPENIDYNLR